MATSADVYAPFATGAGANTGEDTWRKFMKRPTVSGVLRNILNEHSVYADSSGMQVKLRTGEVWIEGHWGTTTTEKTLPVTAAHATLARIDRVVARCDFVGDVIEYDVVAGTAAASPVAPSVTRDSSKYEVSLATISVPAADTSIDSGQVTDERTFGGVPYSAQTDDQLFFGEKMSTIARQACTTSSSMNNDFLYLARMLSQTENVVSELRIFTTTAQVAGSCSWGIYKGFTQRALSQVATGSITLTGSTDTVKTATFTPITLEAGMQVVVGFRVTGSTTAPVMACTGNVISGNFINPTGPTAAKTNVFKNGGTLTSTIDLLDGTYTNSTVFRWVALK